MTDDTMNRNEVAALLGIGLGSVDILQRKDPRFPRPSKLGKRCIWDRGDVIAYKQAVAAANKAENRRRLELANPKPRGAR